MTSLAQHTPLESLLLLHALRSDGLTAIRFNHISEQLKSIPLIRNDPSYDSSRLDEEALKHLYLRLLKDEARDNSDQQHDRKRRQLSPSLPTVEEAAKHSHLIPRLVHRLYTSYREGVVAEIRNEEARYDTLTREIGEIENGQWDDRLRSEQPAPTPPVQPSPADATAKSPAVEEPTQINGSAAATAHPLPEPARLNRAKIDAVINHEPVAVRPNVSPTPPLPPSSSQPQQQNAPPPLQHRLSTTSLPPLSEMAPESPVPQPPLPQHVQHSHVPPQLPAPIQSGQGYRVSPVIQQNAFPPQFARPNAQPSPHHSPSPSSPRPVLPLPPGMSLPPQPHSPALSNRGGPAQYPSPTQRLPPVPLQPATRAPHMHTPPAYHQPYPAYPQQPSYPPQQPPPQPYGQRPPHQGGYQLPPFQVSAQDPNRMHQHHLAQQQAAQQQARPPPTPARQAVPATYSPHTPYSYPAPIYPRSEPANVIDVLSSLKKSSRPSTPRPTWKHFRPSYLSRPYMEETASPAVERASPPPPSRAASPVRANSEIAVKPKPTKEPPSQVEDVVEPAPKPTKSSRKSTRRNRAASNASSAIASSVRARTRSHSVLSHAESQGQIGEPTAVSRIVKDEPMTPADLLQEEILQAETSDPPSQIRSSRQRGRAVTGKRKRGRSASVVASSEPPAEASEEADRGPAYEPPLKNKVQAHRNFARISNVIINDITQHKHAGPFQKPVREKDAEGYSDIIKRPQDLKSIKAAITAGARAINAATSTTDSPAATPSGSGSASSVVLLDKTADLIPPRAIVNSSQLEKEVMRMFANAVMFNPGDTGMVQDAREMADDIEAKVRDWRQVEGAAASSRAALQDEDDDAVVSGSAAPAKRRKV